jgi:hypothetical protein
MHLNPPTAGLVTCTVTPEPDVNVCPDRAAAVVSSSTGAMLTRAVDRR